MDGEEGPGVEDVVEECGCCAADVGEGCYAEIAGEGATEAVGGRDASVEGRVFGVDCYVGLEGEHDGADGNG